MTLIDSKALFLGLETYSTLKLYASDTSDIALVKELRRDPI